MKWEFWFLIRNKRMINESSKLVYNFFSFFGLLRHIFDPCIDHTFYDFRMHNTCSLHIPILLFPFAYLFHLVNENCKSIKCVCVWLLVQSNPTHTHARTEKEREIERPAGGICIYVCACGEIFDHLNDL